MPILVLKTVNRCNSDCIYCFTDKSGKLKKMNLPLLQNLFYKISQYLGLHHDKSVEIQWHGGEPLLLGMNFYADVARIQAEICSECRPRIMHSFQSNLTLLTEDYLQVLKALNLKNVGTSVDPDCSVRILKNSDDPHAYQKKFLAGLMLLEKSNIDYGINYVVTKKSLDHPENVFHYLANINPKGTLSINPVMIKDAALKDLEVSPEDFTEFVQQTFPLWWQIRDRISSAEPYETLTDSVRSLLNNDHTKETHREIPVIIDTEGYYHHYKSAGEPLGSIYNETIGDMINKTNQFHCQLINDLKGVRNCSICSLWPFCYANTVMDAFSQNDELLDDSWCFARINLIKNFLLNFLNEKNEAA